MKTILINRLSNVLEVVFAEIKLCYYFVDYVAKEEYVRIITNDNTSFDICVTADSAAALIDDVWKECKSRFA